MLDKFFSAIERFVPVKWRWVLGHGGFRRYFANTGWMFFGQMFGLCLSFFIGVWLARYLGPKDYGTASYIVAFVGLFSFIANLGVDGILNKELIESPDKKNELLGTSFFLKLFGGITSVVFVIIFSFLFEASVFNRVLIIFFSLTLLTQAINVISIFFHSNTLSKNSVKAILFATIISSILKIFIILFNKGVVLLIIIYFLDSIWQGIGFLFYYKKNGFKIRNWIFDKRIAKNILRKSLFLMLSSASVYIYMKIDQVFINHFIGEEAVGLYAVAVRFTEVWYFIPSIICSSVFPALINSKKSSDSSYKKRFNTLHLFLGSIAFFIAFFSSIFSSFIIKFLFGADYILSVPILQIYIWSSVGLFLGISMNQYFLSEGKIRLIFYFNLISMAINIVLNIILIPRIGLSGAAWATFIAYSINPILAFLFKNVKLKKYEKGYNIVA